MIINKVSQRQNAFTLIELLVVIAIIAILSIVVILTLNPGELIKQSHDSNRISDITTISEAVGLSQVEQSTLGNASTVYVSIPDLTLSGTATSTCASLGLPTSSLPTGWNYQCTSLAAYKNIDGTGWIPINFTTLSSAPLTTLPVDPTNTTSSGLYYTYTTLGGLKYELTANLESVKDQIQMSNDSGQYNNLYEKGNSTTLLPIDYSSTKVGTIYVTYLAGPEGVEEFSPNGTFVLRMGSSGVGNGQFNIITGLVVDSSSNEYVSDQLHNNVTKFSPNGTYLSQFGTTGSSTGKFNGAGDLAFSADGNLYVADVNNNRVQKLSLAGTYISQFGTTGSGTGQFNGPAGIAVDPSGNVYVSDYGNSRVEKFNASGTYLLQFGSFGTSTGQFDFGPDDVAVNSTGNTVYVSDPGDGRVEMFNSAGTYIGQFGSIGNGNGQFAVANGYDDGPGGLAFDASGNIYVTDQRNHRIQLFTASGTYISQFPWIGTGFPPWGTNVPALPRIFIR